ncbi:MAG: ribonuclease III [Deltaproteobacteria bacterium]|nr:ribonuclease III [Deltaproteobacteria bacterium]
MARSRSDLAVPEAYSYRRVRYTAFVTGLDSGRYDRLERKLGFSFREPSLLEVALTHKSFLNETPGLKRGDNERLEFLGDAVLGLVIGHLLMERFPTLREGELSVMRARIVNEQGLAEVALDLDLGAWLFLGKGEDQTGGRKKPSLLADATEAVVGAVYLDGGFSAVFDVLRHLFASRLGAVEASGFTDFKTRLQERAQGLLRETPRYALVGQKGPDHDKTFEVAVLLGGKELARGDGRSKKEAEQRAAEKALGVLPGDPTSPSQDAGPRGLKPTSSDPSTP